MIKSQFRIAAAFSTMIALGACSAIQEGAFSDAAFWSQGPIAENSRAELGLAELAKGNNVGALANFESALKVNPNDVHALFGSALVYQNTGQPERARDFYEQILLLDPPPSDTILVWSGNRPQMISELAGINLTLMQGRPASQMAAQASGDMNSDAMPTSQLHITPNAPSMAVANIQAGEIRFADGDASIVGRFKSVRQLMDQGLITQDEFLLRRNANIGALLPLTSPPPSAGLDRPVPPADQIAGRLRAISRALEMRAITVGQHGAERSMILDALMPAKISSVALPPPPPSGLMQAADAVRRIEMLKQVDLITSDEYTRERAAIEQAMQTQAGASVMSAAKAAAMPQTLGGAKTMSGSQPGVHLASYRQQKAAERGWVELSKRFASQLDGLVMNIERIDLGGTKGKFYRLKAGPLASNAEAKSLCRTLKASRQYCEPTTVEFN